MRIVSNKSSKYLSIAILSFLMTGLVPQSAFAVGLPVATADSGGTLAKELGDMFASAERMIYKQLDITVADNQAHTTAQLTVARDYTVHPELFRVCDIAQRGSSLSAMHGGSQSVGGALANAPNQTTGMSDAKVGAMAAKSGYIDPNDNKNFCSLAGVTCNLDPKRKDADINWATVSADNMMQLPTGITAPNGMIKLPDVSTVGNAHQKAFIDAYTVCVNSRPKDVDPVGGTPGQSTATAQAEIATFGTQGQRRTKLESSASFNTCTKEVMRNTAVTPSVGASLGGDFLVIANAQQNYCNVLKRDGVADAAVTSCPQNGISEAKAQELDINAVSSPNYAAVLSGRGLTGPMIAQVLEEDRNAMTTNTLLTQLLEAQKAVVANTGPKQSQFTANAMNLRTAELMQQQIAQEKDLLDQQHQQFSEMTGLLRTMVDQNQAIIANQRKVQEAKATGDREVYRVTPIDIKSP